MKSPTSAVFSFLPKAFYLCSGHTEAARVLHNRLLAIPHQPLALQLFSCCWLRRYWLVTLMMAVKTSVANSSPNFEVVDTGVQVAVLWLRRGCPSTAGTCTNMHRARACTPLEQLMHACCHMAPGSCPTGAGDIWISSSQQNLQR